MWGEGERDGGGLGGPASGRLAFCIAASSSTGYQRHRRAKRSCGGTQRSERRLVSRQSRCCKAASCSNSFVTSPTWIARAADMVTTAEMRQHVHSLPLHLPSDRCPALGHYLRAPLGLSERVVVPRKLDEPVLLDDGDLAHEALGRFEHLVEDDEGLGRRAREEDRGGMRVEDLCGRDPLPVSSRYGGSRKLTRKERSTHCSFAHRAIRPIRLQHGSVAEVSAREAATYRRMVFTARDDGDLEPLEILGELCPNREGARQGFEVESVLQA